MALYFTRQNDRNFGGNLETSKQVACLFGFWKLLKNVWSWEGFTVHLCLCLVNVFLNKAVFNCFQFSLFVDLLNLPSLSYGTLNSGWRLLDFQGHIFRTNTSYVRITGCVLAPFSSMCCCRPVLVCFGRSLRSKSAERCKLRHAMCSDNIGIGDSAIFSLICFPHERSSHNIQ